MGGFGAVIRRHRNERGLSQQDLAVAVGKSVAAVTQWEREIIVPRRGTAEALDKALSAGGEILAALGYTGPVVDLERLRDQVTKHESRIADLEALVEAVTERLRAVTERAIRSDTDATPRPVGRSGRPVDRPR